MFQLLRLKFSITAHCFQVNSLTIRLANVLRNSSRFSCWNGDWKSGRDSTLSSVIILSNSPHGLATLKDSADPARGFVLKFPDVTPTADESAATKCCQTHLPVHDPKVLQNVLVKSGASTLPFTWESLPRGWRQTKFCIWSSSTEYVTHNWLHAAGILAVLISAPAAEICVVDANAPSQNSLSAGHQFLITGPTLFYDKHFKT